MGMPEKSLIIRTTTSRIYACLLSDRSISLPYVAHALLASDCGGMGMAGGGEAIEAGAQLGFGKLEVAGEDGGEGKGGARQVRGEEGVERGVAGQLLGGGDVLWIAGGDERMAHVLVAGGKDLGEQEAGIELFDGFE